MTYCSIKLKIRDKTRQRDISMARLGSNAGELNDALVSAMKRGGRILWVIGDEGDSATASFSMSDVLPYTKDVLKKSAMEFDDDEDIACEMKFSSSMPEYDMRNSCHKDASFFSRVRSWLRM